MKSRKLQDAIGMVDPVLLERTNKSLKTRSRKVRALYTTSIAAVLVVVICMGVFLSGLKNGNYLQISKAQYPKMSQYHRLAISLGNDIAYSNWLEDRNKQREYSAQSTSFDAFFEASLSQILSQRRDTENKVYSPVNVYMALSMLAEISEGNTRQQILDLMRIEDISALRTQAHALWNANYSDDGLTTCVLASSLWLRENERFNKATIDSLCINYYADIYQGRMGSKELDNAYNNWLNDHTGNLLKNSINSSLSPETNLALATTINYKAQWSDTFSKSKTEESIFHSPQGDVSCDFMYETKENGTYYWGDKFSSVSKSLHDSGSMIFILPDEGVSVSELLYDEEALSYINYRTSHNDSLTWDNSKNVKIHLYLPKFDISNRLGLKENMQSLGVTDCFEEQNADFSPLLKNSDGTHVSDINHSVRITIDEEGVTGAAYTELFLATGALPLTDEIDFALDRPFIFIVTNYDNTPLFIGVVNNPTLS